MIFPGCLFSFVGEEICSQGALDLHHFLHLSFTSRCLFSQSVLLFCLGSDKSTEDKGFKMRTYSTLHSVKMKHKRQYFNLMMIILLSCSSLSIFTHTFHFIALKKGWNRWNDRVERNRPPDEEKKEIESETNSMQSISLNAREERIEGMLSLHVSSSLKKGRDQRFCSREGKCNLSSTRKV